LLNKLDPYDRQPYTYLESFYRSAGWEEEADEVYYQRRFAEGNRIKPQMFLRWLWDRSYRLIAGYGVKVPLILISTAVLLLGTIVFSNPESTGNPKYPPSRFEAFAVSLHLLTHLDLPSDSQLKPSRDDLVIKGRYLWPGLRYSSYAMLQSVFASLILPFVVATIADRIRHRRA